MHFIERYGMKAQAALTTFRGLGVICTAVEVPAFGDGYMVTW
jgi:hypothetical protein